ncbi:flavin-containing monooxygenase [Tepidamorphus sp. 3E244]|uniref:flavin-containing monooxygenase n=1 Tax=Tepidamorphus sp. 3E244 TaxID=3385498 RepID=UPI0038FCA3A2
MDVLRNALQDADPVPLAMVHAQLTGNFTLLEACEKHVEGAWSFQQNIPNELAARIRAGVEQALADCASGTHAAIPHPDTLRFRDIMSPAIGQRLPDNYAQMFLEEFDAETNDLRDVHWRKPPRPETLARFRVAIVGAGLSGICMGIKLKQLGIPFTIYEKNETVGGTWFENRYPGCGVDIPSHYYSFSFAPKSDWDHHFAKRSQLWRYLEDCVDRFGIREDIVFGVQVEDARFDENRARWIIDIVESNGHHRTVEANVLVTAVGQLNRPSMPDIEGLDTFAGEVFHTAAWPDGVELAGRKVAMVGTGASAMQVGPTIAAEVEQLDIYQRTPHWAMRNANYSREVSPGMKWALANIPSFDRWYRHLLFWASSDNLYASLQKDPDWARSEISLNAENQKMRETILDYIRSQIGDRPDLMEKVIPDYPPYGKRMLRDNGWYTMLRRENVELISGGVSRLEADGVVDQHGHKREADVLILATGFQARRLLWPMDVTGRDGIELRDIWGEDNARAYMGMSVPGFPNFFVMYGPNTNLAHGGSLFFHAECQTRYILQAFRELIEGDHASLEVRKHVHDDYNARVDALHEKMVWTHPGAGNWYKNRQGRVVANSPWKLVDYWALTRELKPQEFIWNE